MKTEERLLDFCDNNPTEKPPYDEIRQAADELGFLRWFFINADFGPASGDVHFHLEQRFTSETGLPVPEGFSWNE